MQHIYVLYMYYPSIMYIYKYTIYVYIYIYIYIYIYPNHISAEWMSYDTVSHFFFLVIFTKEFTEGSLKNHGKP